MAYNTPDNLDRSIVENKPKLYDGGPEDTQAYMWFVDDTCYLAFRGTEDKSDVLADLDVRYYSVTPNVKIHRGFFDQFEAVRKDITTDFEKHPNIKKIVVTGHSLGGALATIAALHFAIQFPELHVACHTFGCPRVGNNEFVETFNKHVHENWRVYNVDDPVPMIPISFRFNHVCNGLCLGNDDKHAIQKSDTHWLLRPVLSIACLDLLKPIAAHDCTLYIDKLESLVFSSSE